MVVVGVAMELWVIRHEWRDDMEAWALTFFGVHRRPLRPELGKLIAEIVSVIFVTVGIIGELGIGMEIASINGTIQGVDTQLRTQNSELRTKSDQLVALINDRAGQADERAGEAEERAARLLADMQPRRLSPDQEKAIGKALKGYAGKIVGVATYHEDAEAMILGIQIEEALGKAKITAWDRIGTFGATGMPLYTGVVVDTNHPNNHLTSDLLKALSKEGRLVTSSAPVMFGQGSTMYVPPRPKSVHGASFVEDAMIFVGEKPIAEDTWHSAQSQSTPSAKQ